MSLQIAREIFLMTTTIMKSTLSLLEFKLGKKTEDYIYAKKQIMQCTYENLKKLFKQLQEANMIEKCSCGANLRKGYKSCDFCGGSGFCNKNK